MTAQDVAFTIGDLEIAQMTVDGPVLLAPAGTTVSRSREKLVVTPSQPNIPHSQDLAVPDVFVGSLPILYWSRSLRRPATARLEIPTPPPFEADDAQRMWRELRTCPVPIPDSVAVQGRVESGGKASLSATHLELTQVANALARGLALSREWPQLETSETFWRPIDLRGGREDGRLTEREERRIAISRESTRQVPDRSARRRASTDDWRSSRIAIVTRALRRSIAERADEHEPSTELRGSERLLDQIARRATSPFAARDVGPSSWPSRLRTYYADALRAFSLLEATRAGLNEAPLSRLWELYEVWVTVRCFHLLRDVLGEPTSPTGAPSGGARWRAEWTGGHRRVLMYVQPAIAGDKFSLTESAAVRSVTSTLIPDVVIAVERPPKALRIIVLDAKKRGTGTAMTAGDVAEAASKYLWGIVCANEASNRAVKQVVIAASALDGASMYSSAAAIEACVVLPARAKRFAETLRALVVAE